jgi:signal peptide peptidase SppA
LKLLDLLTSPWAIQPEKLAEILAIYAARVHGEEPDIKAVEARLGRPLSNEQQEYTVRDGGVAVLGIEGVIAPKANLFTQISGGVSSQMLQTQLESAIADPRVKSVVLAIDSPGGSVFGAPEFAAAVRDLSQQKPIVAVSDGVIASAAYWIGSAANAVFLSGPTVHAGSIGVVMAHEFNPRAQGRITEISAGKYKRIASEHSPLSEEAKAYLQDRVDHLYSVFVDAVAEHRGVAATQVLADMADGRVFVGQQAIDAGLADGFMTVDAAAEALALDPGHYAKRRRAQPRSQAARAPTATAPITTKPQPGAITMDRTTLEAEHPQLFAELRDTFRAEGAAAESARIQSVEAVALAGHEALIASLKFDGKTSGPQAAEKVLAAEKSLRASAAASLQADAPQPAKPAAAPSVEAAAAEDTSLPVEERCKARWERDPKVRGEFLTLAAYTAFARAEEAGKVRVLNKRAA